MGSECHPSRSYYDVTMSKRTRKPWSSDRISHQRSMTIASAGSERFIDYIGSEEDDLYSINGEGSSSKEVNLYVGDHEITEEMKSEGNKLPDDTARGGEENKLQIVTMQKGGDKGGANLGKLLGRYMKAFTHVVRIKKGHRLASLKKKKVLQLPK